MGTLIQLNPNNVTTLRDAYRSAIVGDEVWASLFERSAQRLEEDWTFYEREIPELAGALDAVA